MVNRLLWCFVWGTPAFLLRVKIFAFLSWGWGDWMVTPKKAPVCLFAKNPGYLLSWAATVLPSLFCYFSGPWEPPKRHSTSSFVPLHTQDLVSVLWHSTQQWFEFWECYIDSPGYDRGLCHLFSRLLKTQGCFSVNRKVSNYSKVNTNCISLS